MESQTVGQSVRQEGFLTDRWMKKRWVDRQTDMRNDSRHLMDGQQTDRQVDGWIDIQVNQQPEAGRRMTEQTNFCSQHAGG